MASAAHPVPDTRRTRSHGGSGLAEPPCALHPIAEPLSSDTLAAANRLYRATLDLLTASDDPATDCHLLTGPLSQVVALQRTRIGQADCAELAQALAASDHAAALNACSRLIELERQRQDDLGTPP